MYTVEHVESCTKFNVVSPSGSIIDSYTYVADNARSIARALSEANSRCTTMNKLWNKDETAIPVSAIIAVA